MRSNKGLLQLAAVGIVLAGWAIGYAFVWRYVEGLEGADVTRYQFGFFVAIVGVFAFFAGTFVGIGSLIASFGVEVKDGTFDYKDTRYGRLVKYLTNDCKSWCGIGGTFAFILLAATAVSLILSGAVYIVATVDQVNWARMIEAFTMMGKILLGLVAAMVAYLASLRYFPKTTVASVVLGVIGFVVYAVATKGLPPFTSPTLEDLILMAKCLAFAGSIAGAVFGAKWVLKKTGVYGAICPAPRHPPKTEEQTA